MELVRGRVPSRLRIWRILNCQRDNILLAGPLKQLDIWKSFRLIVCTSTRIHKSSLFTLHYRHLLFISTHLSRPLGESTKKKLRIGEKNTPRNRGCIPGRYAHKTSKREPFMQKSNLDAFSRFLVWRRLFGAKSQFL